MTRGVFSAITACISDPEGLCTKGRQGFQIASEGRVSNTLRISEPRWQLVTMTSVPLWP